MANLKKNNLAIIGLGIAGDTFSYLDQFGFEIYRGIPFHPNNQEASPDSRKCMDVFNQMLAQAKTNSKNIRLIVLNSEIVKIFQNMDGALSATDFSSLKSPLEMAFRSASDWLESKETDTVFLFDMDSNRQIISGVALCLPQFAVENGTHILGELDGFLAVSSVDSQKEMESNSSHSESMGLLLVPGQLSDFLNSSPPKSFVKPFPRKNGPTCALSQAEGGLTSILKLIWCLTRRVIPGAYSWNQTEVHPEWKNSAFYVPTESRTRFLPDGQTSRIGGIIVTDNTKQYFLFTFKSDADTGIGQDKILPLEPLSLFLFSGTSVDDIQQQMEVFSGRLAPNFDLHINAKNLYSIWNGNPTSSLKACILARSQDELKREIEFAIKGIPDAAAKNSDWRTPMGSYFSPLPLGKTGSISFVYPGAFNSYPGIGKDLFYLFPSLYNRLSEISTDIGKLINETSLYPRSITKLTAADLDLLEKQLTADPLAMLISGTSLAALYTFLLREVFDIHPTSSFGYSLGEISMMFASGVWSKGDETSEALRKSPLFRTRLAGPQFAVRDHWKKAGNITGSSNKNIWANFVLMAAHEKAASAVQQEELVFITHINTPRQVVIGGDPDGCRRVIDTLKCNALEAPFNYALHCEAMESEHAALQQLLSWPVQNEPGMELFSAANYTPMPIEQENISQQIAYGLCHLLDFPRLVNTAYDNGARIFIELGAGSNCARWVDDSLQGRSHAAFSINRKGVDDHTAVTQLLAKLICHQIPINLSLVFA